jgi:hypothetical protein
VPNYKDEHQTQASRISWTGRNLTLHWKGDPDHFPRGADGLIIFKPTRMIL